jgi:hypothetical protein
VVPTFRRTFLPNSPIPAGTPTPLCSRTSMPTSPSPTGIILRPFVGRGVGSANPALNVVRNGPHAALLGPDTVAASVDPRSPGPVLPGGAVAPAHDGCVAVGGQRDGVAHVSISNRIGGDQFTALLRPDTVAAGEDPHCPGALAVQVPALDRSVAVGGQRDRAALESQTRGRPMRSGSLAGTLGCIVLGGRRPPRACSRRGRIPTSFPKSSPQFGAAATKPSVSR